MSSPDPTREYGENSYPEDGVTHYKKHPQYGTTKHRERHNKLKSQYSEGYQKIHAVSRQLKAKGRALRNLLNKGK